MITQANYLNLYHILVEEVIGSFWLFLIIGLIIVLYVSVKYRLPNQVAMAFMVMFVLISVAWVYNAYYLMLVLVLVGLLVYLFLPKMFRR